MPLDDPLEPVHLALPRELLLRRAIEVLLEVHAVPPQNKGEERRGLDCGDALAGSHERGKVNVPEANFCPIHERAPAEKAMKASRGQR